MYSLTNRCKKIVHCKEEITKLNDTFGFLSKVIQLAGNEVRLKILYLLAQENELCVCDLSDILNMNVSAISQHLRKLKDRDIILPNRKAQTIYYKLNKKHRSILQPFFNLIEDNKILETL